MQMEDGLPAVGVRIDNHSITVFRKALLTCDRRRAQKQMTESALVVLFGFVERVDMITRNDQDVGRGLWTEIVERNTRVVLVNPSRRDLARGDLAEDAVVKLHVRSYYLSKNGSKCLGGLLLGREVVGYALDVGTQGPQLSDDRFVTAIDVIDAIDQRLATRT